MSSRKSCFSNFCKNVWLWWAPENESSPQGAEILKPKLHISIVQLITEAGHVGRLPCAVWDSGSRSFSQQEQSCPRNAPRPTPELTTLNTHTHKHTLIPMVLLTARVPQQSAHHVWDVMQCSAAAMNKPPCLFASKQSRFHPDACGQRILWWKVIQKRFRRSFSHQYFYFDEWPNIKNKSLVRQPLFNYLFYMTFLHVSLEM